MIYFVGNKRPPSKIYKQSSTKDFLKWVKGRTELQIDSETIHPKEIDPEKIPLTPYNSTILCIQVGDKEKIDQWLFENQFEVLQKVMEDQSVCKILTNAFYDLRYFRHLGWDVHNIYDCFAAEMILTLGRTLPKGYRGLEQMAMRYCGIVLDKEIRSQINERGLDDEVIKYSAGDVTPMSEIKEKQLREIENRHQEVELRRLNRFIITLANISYVGFKVDVPRLNKNTENNKKLLEKQIKLLNEYALTLGFEEILNDKGECKVKVKNKWTKLNWNSSKQVLPIFKKLGIYCLKRDKETGEMKDSVEAKHLVRQKNKFPILPIYLKYKEITKEISTYGDKLRDKVSPVTGRIHSEFFPILDTGRISSSKPNLQNITAEDDEGNPSELRKCFIPEKGNVLIIGDWKAQEPRITAEYSQDPFLIDFIMNGDGDTHSLVATAISSYLLGKEVKVSKENNPLVPKYNMKIRAIGKIINLGLDYGKTAYSVKDDLEISEKEAQAIIDALKAKTPKKQEYFEQQANFLKKHGYIIIDKVTNRRAYFDGWEDFLRLSRVPYENRTRDQISKYFKLKGNIERMAANYPIQGTGGSMSSIAAIMFEDEVKEKELNAFIVNLVHDEIVVECEESIAEEVKEILNDCMMRSGSLFCETIPMKVDLYVGDSWAIKA